MATKRTDGRYTIKKTFNGKPKYFYGKTKKEAREKLQQYEKEFSSCLNFNGAITLYEWINNWLTIKEKTITIATLNSYKGIISRYILPAIGGIKLADIRPAQLRKVFDNMQHLSTRTITYTMTILNSVLELAVRDEIIPKNYMKNIDRPKHVKTKEMITLNANEIKQFLNVITNSEHYALFKLAFASGMRRSELLGLTWSNVHFNKSTISIEQTALRINGGGVLSPTTKTDSSRRTISIDADTMAILRKHKTTIDKRMLATPNWTNHNLVFPGIHGGPRNPDEVSRLCKHYAKLIGKPAFSMHGTRHTHATLLIESGANIKAVQTRLGHASFEETMNTYSHVTPTMEDDLLEKIEKIF